MALVTQAVGAAIKYGALILVAQWIGAVGFGVYSLGVSAAQILGLVAGLGLGRASLRFVPEFIERNEPARLRGFVTFSRRSVALAGLVFGLAVALLGGQWLEAPAALAVGVAIPLLAFVNLQREMLRAFSRVFVSLFPPLVLMPAAWTVGVWWIVQGGLSESEAGAAALWAWAAAAALVLVPQALALRRATTQIAPAAPAQAPRAWLPVALPMLGSALPSLLLANTDILMLGALSGTDDAGHYAAAAKTAALVALTLGAANIAGAPLLAGAFARGGASAILPVFRTTLVWSSIAGLVTAGILAASRHMVLALFGEGFGVAATSLLILLAGQAVNALCGPVGLTLALTGHERATLKVYAVAATVNIVLNLLLIPVWGLPGAAGATALSAALWNIWLTVLTQRRLGVSLLSVWSRR